MLTGDRQHRRFHQDSKGCILASPDDATTAYFNGSNGAIDSFGRIVSVLGYLSPRLVNASTVAGACPACPRVQSCNHSVWGIVLLQWDPRCRPQLINHWIRMSSRSDGVIDFGSTVCAAAEPSRLAAAFASGDHLHLSAEAAKSWRRDRSEAVYRHKLKRTMARPVYH